MDTTAYDWRHFSITFYYPVPVETAFRAWATQAGLQSFFIQTAEFVAPGGQVRTADELVQTGDRFSWAWRHQATLTGEIRGAKPGSELTFTFGSMLCRISFRSAGEAATMVHLHQTNIADDADGQVMGHLNCRSCWIFFMTNLKSVLASGLDLRDDDPARVSSLEVGYSPDEL